MATVATNVDMIAKLKAVPALKDFDEATLKSLADGTRFVRVDSNEALFNSAEEAHYGYVISYGSIKLTRSVAAGKEIVMCFLRPGDFVGVGVLTHTHPRYPLSAVALEDSGFIQIPRENYLKVWQMIPSLAREVNINITGRLMEFQQDKAISTSPVPHKIASFLLRTLDAQPKGFGSTINLRLTRRDIAERVGSTVETVIRVMSTWSQKGWITTEDQHVTILDRAALETLIREAE